MKFYTTRLIVQSIHLRSSDIYSQFSIFAVKKHLNDTWPVISIIPIKNNIVAKSMKMQLGNKTKSIDWKISHLKLQ